MGPSHPTLRTLGDFEIIGEIGRGGMGVVYEARQTSLNRRVALKVLSSGLGLTAKAVMRFRREAEAAAKLHHTNIVPIYATGEEHGIHFYAMELIDGPSLDQVIRHMRTSSTGMPPTQELDSTADSPAPAEMPNWVSETMVYKAEGAASNSVTSRKASDTTGSGISSGTRYFDQVACMIADVADALQHAHDEGVIHRDIKPSNLLLSAEGRLSLNDFGLARVLEQPGMTMSGEFVGSPLYMSPEQITAGRAPLDHRTDVYSLGATLYELLTLRPPFPGQQRDQVIGQILHKDPVLPRRSNRRVPIDLETICLKAMEKDPDRRYQAAGEMADDLRRFVNRFAISARRIGPLGRVVKWTRRHPSLAASLLVTLLAVSTAAVLNYRNYISNKQSQLSRVQENAFASALGGDFAKAEEFIKEAELLGAHIGWVRMMRGQIALYRGDYEGAIDELTHAQDLLQESTASYALLTQAYGESGDEDTCRRRVAELRRRAAYTFEDYLFKGRALAFAFPDEAISNLDKALERSPTSIVVRLVRSRAERIYAMDRADPEYARRAREDAAAAKTFLPDNPIAVSEFIQATIVAANIAKEHGQAAEAERLMADVDLDGIDEQLLLHSEVRRARWQYWLDDEQDDMAAEEILRAPLGEKPQDAYLAMLGAIDLYRQKRNDDAMRVYRSATGPVKALSQFVEAFIRMDGEERESLLTEYKNALAKKPSNAYLIFDWAVLKLLRDDPAAATVGRNLQALMRGNPDSVGHDRLYAFLAGDITSRELMRETGKARSFDCGAYFMLGIEALAAGNRDEAKRLFEACVATDYFNYYFYHLSRAWLVRVDDRKWLRWISTPE